MKTEPSPGPWTAPPDKSFYVIGKNGGLIASCCSRKNAVCISAAPDMLDALRKAKNWMDVEDWDFLDEHDRSIIRDTLDSINNAINKATQS